MNADFGWNALLTGVVIVLAVAIWRVIRAPRESEECTAPGRQSVSDWSAQGACSAMPAIRYRRTVWGTALTRAVSVPSSCGGSVRDRNLSRNRCSLVTGASGGRVEHELRERSGNPEPLKGIDHH